MSKDQQTFRFLNSLDEDELAELELAYEVKYTHEGTKLDQIQDLLEANVNLDIANKVLNIAKREQK